MPGKGRAGAHVKGRVPANGPLTGVALNRALLGRQLLLERSPAGAEEVVRRLVAVNAQQPDIAHIGLAARLKHFHPDDLDRLIRTRRVVRATFLRTTIHLVTAADYLALRAALQPRLDATLRNEFPELRDLDRETFTKVCGEILAKQALTRAELGRALAVRFPHYDAEALAFASTRTLPLVHLPPAGEWGSRARARYASAEAWLGQPLAPRERAEEDLVRRYLAAFGPASVADLSAWSGVAGLQGAVARIEKDLVTIAGAGGRTLWDVPDSFEITDDPAPLRLLPAYDNVLFGHSDRSRVVPGQYRESLSRGAAAVLAGGFVCGTWRLTRGRPGTARFEVRGAPDLAADQVQAETSAMAERLFGGEQVPVVIQPPR